MNKLFYCAHAFRPEGLGNVAQRGPAWSMARLARRFSPRLGRNLGLGQERGLASRGTARLDQRRPSRSDGRARAAGDQNPIRPRLPLNPSSFSPSPS